MKKLIEIFRETFRVLRKLSNPNYDRDLLEIVFEHRNKAYGAYVLRKSYNSSLGKALIVTYCSIGMIATLLALNQRKNGISTKSTQRNVVIEVKTQHTVIESEIPKPKPKQAVPPSGSTQIYTQPIVVPDHAATHLEHPKSAIEVLSDPDAVGTQDTQTSSGASGFGTGDGMTVGGGNTQVVATPAEPETNEIMDFAEYPAEFPGGTEALLQFLQQQIKYPALARELNIQGRVFVQFVVEKDGSLTQVSLVKDIGAGCGAEALRVVKLMPQWKPARQNGHHVRTRFTVPILFKLMS